MIRTLIYVALSFFLTTVSTAADPIRVLFLGDNGHHQPKPRFDELAPVMQQRGIELEYTDEMSKLSEATLTQYDALLLYANIDNIAADQAEALLSYVDGGGGFVPLHCATFCFRNNDKIVALMGAQFKRHGTGVFRTDIAAPEHPVMAGFGGFESWDETYVHHLHNETNRTVLEYRVDAEGREPWTWVREHGKGQVFYTAWGHDSRTWTNPGFQNLVERGIRYVAHREPAESGDYQLDAPFLVPQMTEKRSDVEPFRYADVGREIPNYTPSDRWGVQGEPLSLMQEPLSPNESLKHIVTPQGFRVELFVSEPELQGKPICMAWDERGRLWVAETYDYPNELQPQNKGRDRIRICEDSDGDWKADKFTVFAEELSIPTSIAFARDGVIVQNGSETLFLKDTDGDDRADQREQLLSGWALEDTHGGVSNFQYGLDNWIWAMQGYNMSEPVSKTADAKPGQKFRMGFFRMRPDGSEVEFIRSTNNNTWGLGLSEEGMVFGSTANGTPSVFMPIANRYYERVRGWTPSLTLSSIADSNAFHPITDKVRQVDHHGGYTAGAGHALYTARQYPQEYWNRVAFVNGPTGHLTGAFVLKPNGSGFTSTSPFNLVASDDEWTAPIMTEIGPDGNAWVIDWYNYIVQHNPTPQGFQTGKGRAYETKLRDKKHGRIYRVVYDQSPGQVSPKLSKDSPEKLIAALSHSVMLVRKHAQRLLVERGNDDVTNALIQLSQDQSVDAVGLNVGAIHALWTLQGLGQLDGEHAASNAAAYAALRHPSAGVRRAAIEVLPRRVESVTELLDAGVVDDTNFNTRLAAVLSLADLPVTPASGEAVLQVLSSSTNLNDPWIPDAATSAAAHNSSSFLTSLADAKHPSPRLVEIVSLVAGHYARGNDTSDLESVVAGLVKADKAFVDAVFSGFASGWKDDNPVKLTEKLEADLEALLLRVDSGTAGTLVKLATNWGSKRFVAYNAEIAKDLLEKVQDTQLAEGTRISAAKELIQFKPDSDDVIQSLLDELTPRTSPTLAKGLIDSLELSRAESLGKELVSRLAAMTPSAKTASLTLLLKRPASTQALLAGAEQGTVSLSDLALDQKQSLATHPDSKIRDAAKKLLASGGSLPSPDRQKVLEELSYVTKQSGDAALGKEVFKTHCSKCHIHSGEGVVVGPDLTGMAVHPKEELLIHILDPSRSVEGNFRVYTVLTSDGLVLSGMLASESKTSLELFDNEGKKRAVLREDIDELLASTKSVMPEGFEKSIKPEEMTNLLAFLTKRGKYVPLDLSKAATVASDRGMFIEPTGEVERLVFDNWSVKTVHGVPFHLIDPRSGTVRNVIELFGPNGRMSRSMPKQVSLLVNGPVKSLHLLSGVSGWGSPYGEQKSVSMIVQLKYADGSTEDHELLNGVHFADYIRRVDVPGSEFAFDLSGRQIRYLAIHPKRTDVVESVALIKGSDSSAPVVMAATVESP